MSRGVRGAGRRSGRRGGKMKMNEKCLLLSVVFFQDMFVDGICIVYEHNSRKPFLKQHTFYEKSQDQTV